MSQSFLKSELHWPRRPAWHAAALAPGMQGFAASALARLCQSCSLAGSACPELRQKIVRCTGLQTSNRLFRLGNAKKVSTEESYCVPRCSFWEQPVVRQLYVLLPWPPLPAPGAGPSQRFASPRQQRGVISALLWHHDRILQAFAALQLVPEEDDGPRHRCCTRGTAQHRSWRSQRPCLVLR